MTDAERATYLVNSAAYKLHLGKAGDTPVTHHISGCFWSEALAGIAEAEGMLQEAKLKLMRLARPSLKRLPSVRVTCEHDEADDGETTHYGGEIYVQNGTNVDIVIQCHGDDRSDDFVYVPTMDAIADALGLVPSEFWSDDLIEVFQGLISPNAEFEVGYDDKTLLVATGTELTVYPAPPQKGKEEQAHDSTS